MAAKIIDGKALSQKIKEDIARQVKYRLEQGKRAPGLAVVLVGEDPASQIYVKNKTKSCEQIGFISRFYHYAITDTCTLLSLIDQLNNDNTIDGILIQLPLPANIDKEQVLERVHPSKDVDGFHPYNIGRLCQRAPTLRPCTPYGIVKMLMAYDIATSGKNAVVVGASNIVGRPMAMELLLLGCTTTITHSRTIDLEQHVRRSDIVIGAVGHPEMVKGTWIKEGAVVIDVGINRLSDGRIIGDIEYVPAAERASWITPVPGGVGPMTVAMLMSNTLEACEKYHDK